MPPRGKTKEFGRFPHEGVRNDLEQIMKHFERDPEIVFGSSGDGQLTLSSSKRTAYVRRYKRRDGWNASVTRGPEGYHPPTDFSAKSELLDYLEKMLR